MNWVLEKESAVEILGSIVKIKPLTLKQTICLGALLGGFYERFKSEKDGGNFLFSFLKNAPPAKADEIINILSNFSFAEYKDISEKISLAEISALVKAVSEVNDFEGIAANFKFAFARMTI